MNEPGTMRHTFYAFLIAEGLTITMLNTWWVILGEMNSTECKHGWGLQQCPAALHELTYILTYIHALTYIQVSDSMNDLDYQLRCYPLE